MTKIMIVDDSMVLRDHIENYSIANNFEVVAKARDGADAVRKFELKKPDLVTMDLTMPHMDGVDCISKIMKIDPTTKILVISALADKYTALMAISQGARGFLNKPFSEEELIDALNKVLKTG